jgi:hypothetical protein
MGSVGKVNKVIFLKDNGRVVEQSTLTYFEPKNYVYIKTCWSTRRQTRNSCVNSAISMIKTLI